MGLLSIGRKVTPDFETVCDAGYFAAGCAAGIAGGLYNVFFKHAAPAGRQAVDVKVPGPAHGSLRSPVKAEASSPSCSSSDSFTSSSYSSSSLYDAQREFGVSTATEADSPSCSSSASPSSSLANPSLSPDAEREFKARHDAPQDSKQTHAEASNPSFSSATYPSSSSLEAQKETATPAALEAYGPSCSSFSASADATSSSPCSSSSLQYLQEENAASTAVEDSGPALVEANSPCCSSADTSASTKAASSSCSYGADTEGATEADSSCCSSSTFSSASSASPGAQEKGAGFIAVKGFRQSQLEASRASRSSAASSSPSSQDSLEEGAYSTAPEADSPSCSSSHLFTSCSTPSFPSSHPSKEKGGNSTATEASSPSCSSPSSCASSSTYSSLSSHATLEEDARPAASQEFNEPQQQHKTSLLATGLKFAAKRVPGVGLVQHVAGRATRFGFGLTTKHQDVKRSAVPGSGHSSQASQDEEEPILPLADVPELAAQTLPPPPSDQVDAAGNQHLALVVFQPSAKQRLARAQQLADQSKRAVGGSGYALCVDLCTEGLSLGIEDAKIRARLYNNRGLSQLFLGHLVAALFDCCMAVEINPNMWQPHYSRHLVFEAIGEYKLAAADHNASMLRGGKYVKSHDLLLRAQRPYLKSAELLEVANVPWRTRKACGAKAFREMSRRYHPDKVAEHEKATAHVVFNYLKDAANTCC